MNSYWVRFKDRAPGCVDAEGPSSALRAAEEFGEPEGCDVLPYPAPPRLAVKSKCPAFCHDPNFCSGRTSCPKRYACSE